MMKDTNLRVLLGLATVFLLIFFMGCKSEPQFYSITFDTNGGSAVASQLVQESKNAARPVDPEKSGYSFEGWYEDSTIHTVWSFDAPI